MPKLLKYTLIPLLLLPLGLGVSRAQTGKIQVSGIVTDERDETLVGAVVMLSDKSGGVSTDENGAFTLSVQPNDTLIVTLIGYDDARIPVQGRTMILIKLKEDSEMLEGTVVIGYGSAQKIGNIVGSVKTVSADELVERPSANIGDALQGQVAGLQIFSGSGEPQSSVSIRIHGESSLSLSNAPLYIVDGVPVSSTVFTSINPQDIENISILKDASSTAIYGSRAANGVIFISTKRGRKGDKPSVAVRAQYGVSMLTDYKLDMMNARELLEFEEKCLPALKDDLSYQARKAFILGNNIDFSWKDYLFDSAAPLMQADASVRGATESTTYYLSAGFYSEDGTAKVNSGLQRFNFRTNLDTQISPMFKVGANIALSFSKFRTISTGWYYQSPIMQAIINAPYRVPYEIIVNPDGSLGKGDGYENYPWDDMTDVLEYYRNNTNNRQNIQLTAQTYEQINPFKGLTLRFRQAVDGYDYIGEAISLPSYGPNDGTGGNSQGFERYYQLSSTNTAEYKTSFGSHFLTFLAGHESIVKADKTFNAYGTGMTDDRTVNFGSALKVTSWGGNLSQNSLNSFFFNVNYDFASKYFIDASIRTDGSSLFGKNHKYATFYSIGGMWKMKQEPFLAGIGWLDELNMNLSYGTTGNSGMSSWYPALGLVGTSSKYNNQAGFFLAQMESPELTWETVALANFILSGKVFGRLGFDFQLYDKTSRDLLMELPFSATTGHGGSWGNVASMSNRGFDLELNADLIHSRNFLWSVRANVNYNRNKILKLYNGLDELSFPEAGLKYQVGKSSSLIYTQVRAGVDPEDGSPMWLDLNGNKTKTYSDEIMQFWGKDTNAPWSGGFSSNISWKNFSLAADFSWIGERWVYINERYYTLNPTSHLTQYNFERKVKDIWTEPGQITDIPKYGTQFYPDTEGYSNAAFLRLKNLSLAWRLPRSTVEKLKVVQSARVYLTGRNLLTFTKFEGYDPEVGYSNATTGLYPNSKQFVLGAEIVF